MSFELKCAVYSVALKLMLAPFISYSLPAVLACQHGGVNRMGHVTAGALLASQWTEALHAPTCLTPLPSLSLGKVRSQPASTCTLAFIILGSIHSNDERNPPTHIRNSWPNDPELEAQITVPLNNWRKETHLEYLGLRGSFWHVFW